MTDRELLEAAARAAGYEVGGYDDDRGVLLFWSHQSEKAAWNPLTDDGDALRLAVALGIGVDHASMRSWAWRCWGTPTVVAKEEFHNNGKDAATRRAIVRAAAEIGKHV